QRNLRTRQNGLNSVENDGDGKKWAKLRDGGGHRFTVSKGVANDVAEGQHHNSDDDG
ncbi:hypothetical protein U1Q18_001256, partial [Sarracenia purpurea var. burkii]